MSLKLKTALDCTFTSLFVSQSSTLNVLKCCLLEIFQLVHQVKEMLMIFIRQMHLNGNFPNLAGEKIFCDLSLCVQFPE